MTKIPFLWGAATSSHQVEGGNTNNDWWQWEEEGNIEGGVTSGLATDHWNRFKEDLRLAADLGLNSYRFSLEWSRVEPEEGKWDPAAFDRYAEMLGECERHGLLPMVTLHHFTSPRWFVETGGFPSESAPDRFGRYVEKVIHELGPRVPLWCTLNEPLAMAVGQHLAAFMPPAQYNPRLVAASSRNLLRCHVRAYDLLHGCLTDRRGPWKDHPLGVGFAHNMIDFLPLRPWNPLERLLVRVFRRIYNRSWPDAVTGRPQHFGLRGLIPYPPEVKEARGRRTADFLGLNYYMKVYVCLGAQSQETSLPQEGLLARPAALPLGVVFAKPKDRTSDLGWAIHPSGMGRMIRFLGRYQLPLYITENGIADRKDAVRADYLMQHLEELARQIGQGADIRGYYHWSLLDNFEWVKGFGPRFGLYEVDYGTLARHRRPSAAFYHRLIETHRASGNGAPDPILLEECRGLLATTSATAHPKSLTSS